MSKNLTLKGAAFGALVALSLAAVAPASAAGLADTSFVSLAPKTGTEYAVQADNGITFSLSANEASTLTVGNLKFLVADASGTVNPAPALTGIAATAIATGAGKIVTITSATTPVIAGQKIQLSRTVKNGTDVVVAAGTYTVGTVTADTSFTLVELGTTASKIGVVADTGGGVNITVQGSRATDNSYVVDSGTNTATSSSDLVLTAPDAVTRSVVVTAWKDANDNNKIDDTEYASPARTVTFVKPSEIVATTSLTPIIGDASATAKITTTPVLNGQQVLAQNAAFVNALFTRQDSAVSVYSAADETGGATAAWNDTTKTWSVAVSLDADASNNNSAVDGGVGTNVVDSWTDLAAPRASTGMTESVAVVKSKVATISVYSGGTATANLVAHGLRVGDKVDFEAAANALIATGAFTVTSIPTTSSFTIALDTADGTLAGTSTDQEYDVLTYANGDSIVDRVFAGTYTAQAYLAGAAAGAKATASTVSVAASKATLSTTASTSVAGFDAKDNTANLVKIKTGTTSVPFTLTAVDADSVAVSAGRPVVVSTEALVTGTAAAVGTFKINGLSSPQTLYTDASGKVSFTLTETAGLVSAQVRVQAVVEGTVTVGADLDWTDQAYGLVDFNTTGGQFTPASTVTVNRAVLSTGSYTLGLGVTDQWFTAGDAATYRLKVTGSGVTEGFVPLTAGKADVKITDSGVTAVGSTFTTTVTLQKATSGVFADTTTVLSVVSTVIKAPSIVTGASGSTLYGNAVVLSANIAAKALVEIDSRSSSTATPAYATNAVVNGAVRNATTSAGIEGAVVSVSGPSTLLFTNGSVAKLGSLSFLSAATTGNFEFNVYSTTAQKDTVVTITVNGVSTTVKVTFTGASTTTKKLTITPNAVTYIPGQAVIYTIKLTDLAGNPVDTAATTAGVTPTAAYISVSYAGPGLISGSLPVETDANGEATVRIVTGTVDTQNAVLTVNYDQNYDGDYADTYDLTVASTVPALVVEPSAIVNVVGHRVYVKFNNAKGEEVTAVFGGVRITKIATYNGYVVSRWIKTPGKVAVKAYVAGDLVKASTVTVK